MEGIVMLDDVIKEKINKTINTMMKKYGEKVTADALEDYLRSGNLTLITRENGCREDFQKFVPKETLNLAMQVLNTNIKSYINEVKAINKGKVSVLDEIAKDTILNHGQGYLEEALESYYKFGNILSFSGNMQEKLQNNIKKEELPSVAVEAINGDKELDINNEFVRGFIFKKYARIINDKLKEARNTNKEMNNQEKFQLLSDATLLTLEKYGKDQALEALSDFSAFGGVVKFTRGTTGYQALIKENIKPEEVINLISNKMNANEENLGDEISNAFIIQKFVSSLKEKLKDDSLTDIEKAELLKRATLATGERHSEQVADSAIYQYIYTGSTVMFSNHPEKYQELIQEKIKPEEVMNLLATSLDIKENYDLSDPQIQDQIIKRYVFSVCREYEQEKNKSK